MNKRRKKSCTGYRGIYRSSSCQSQLTINKLRFPFTLSPFIYIVHPPTPQPNSILPIPSPPQTSQSARPPPSTAKQLYLTAPLPTASRTPDQPITPRAAPPTPRLLSSHALLAGYYTGVWRALRHALRVRPTSMEERAGYSCGIMCSSEQVLGLGGRSHCGLGMSCRLL